MAEEILRRRLADAFDPGPAFPDARLLSRTMAALEAAEGAKVRRRFAMPTGPSRQLVAAALIVLLLIAAAGAFLALQHFVSGPSTVWGGCGGEFQCATVKVPLDYSSPAAGSIDVAVIRKPATDRSHRIGSLVFAGPVAGLDFLRANSVFYSGQFARFDLVGFDQRGFGRSSPVHCLTDAQIDAVNEIDTVLDDPQETQVFVQATQAMAELCQQKSGRLLPFVDTASAARDVDAIRAALGESKITFFGYGYGTFLGQTYAHLFPTHLRAIALDGVVDPATTATEEWRLRAAGYEASLRAFLAACRASASCPLGQSGDPGVRLDHLMQAVDQNPLRVGSRTLGRALAIAGLLYGLDPHNWPQLETALDNAAAGDGSALLALADISDGRNADGGYSLYPEAFAAQFCADHKVPGAIADYTSLGPAMSGTSAIFGPAFQYIPLVCAYWPAKARSTLGPLPAPNAPAELLVAGTHDPYYAFADAQAVSRELPGSVLLTRDGYGVFSYVNSLCVRLAMNAYLTQLVLPAKGTVCESDYPA
jgi:pimeloyl-ACP methyl ester carboxylesterase